MQGAMFVICFKKFRQHKGDEKAHEYLLQLFSVDVQIGNVISILELKDAQPVLMISCCYYFGCF